MKCVKQILPLQILHVLDKAKFLTVPEIYYLVNGLYFDNHEDTIKAGVNPELVIFAPQTSTNRDIIVLLDSALDVVADRNLNAALLNLVRRKLLEE